MKRNIFIISAILLFAIGCEDNNSMDPDNRIPTAFRVTIENIATEYNYAASGIFNTPVGADSPAPITPGEAYEFSFNAAPGSRLSFATMFVHSNDLFYAPMGSGIELFDNMGNQISGNITSQLYLWDAGTEQNQEPGIGMDQAPRQSGPDTGSMDPNSSVRMAMDSFNNLPAISDVINVTLSSISATGFLLRIENVSNSITLMTSDGNSYSVPLAPGVWVVHNDDDPLFSEGMPAAATGLESLAEDGDPAGLGMLLSDMSGVTQIIAPGVFAVHSGENPLFVEGSMDAGVGLESLAEDGSPGTLNTALASNMTVMSHGVFDTPEGNSSPGAVIPGSSYSFEFDASEGYLSFATMLVQSNDLFLSPGMMGIQLFDSNGMAMTGDLTNMISIWDAGTEVNEEPGIGMYQAPHQPDMNSGMDENGVVRMVDDGFHYPAVSEIIRLTITEI